MKNAIRLNKLALLAIIAGVAVGFAADAKKKSPVTTRKSPQVKSAPFVQAAQITVENKLYDPANGSAPKGHENEGALCETKMWSEYTMEWAPAESRKVGNEWIARMELKRVATNVGMGTIIWLPADAPDWMVDHEEIHRAISERVYIEGIPKLSEVLQKMNRKVYEAKAGTDAEAVAAIRKMAAEEISSAYSHLMPLRQQRLNQEFDRRSAHGTNQSKSASAFMTEIFADEAAATQKNQKVGD